MRNSRYPLLLVLGLAGCNQPNASSAPGESASTSVVGTWQLTTLESNRPAGTQLPNQRLMLDANQQLRFYTNDRLTATGTYRLTQGSACSAAPSAELLLRVALATPSSYAPAGNYTLRGNTLIIDQCLAADGPRYTFRRLR